MLVLLRDIIKRKTNDRLLLLDILSYFLQSFTIRNPVHAELEYVLYSYRNLRTFYSVKRN